MTVIQYKQSKLTGGTRTILVATAGEDLDKFTILCKLEGSDTLIAASPYIANCKVVGVCVETGAKDKMIQYINTGIIDCANYNLNQTENNLVYVGAGGVPTTNKPRTGKTIVIGTRLSKTSFKINL